MIEMMMTAFVLRLAVAIPPGAVTIAAGRRAVSFGFGTSMLFTAGTATSDMFYTSLVYLGLAPLIADNETLRLALWIAGGALLLWLGYEAMRTEIVLSTEAVGREPRWRTYTSGVGITLLNPVTPAMWLALAGNFFASWSSDWPEADTVGYIAIIMMVMGTVAWFFFLMSILSRIRHLINPTVLKWVSRVAGLILILFGLSAWWSALMAVA
jgi:putative LysE/RhtB family amino acid efflux pump